MTSSRNTNPNPNPNPNPNRPADYKLVLLGDAGVGKSSLALRFQKDQFLDIYDPTIGASFFSKTIQVDKQVSKLQIWDFSGQERFRSMSPMYTRAAHGLILLLDLTNYDSFLNAEKWLQIVKDGNAQYPNVVLVGAKCDEVHKRVITMAEIDAFKTQHKTEIHSYIEISAKTNENVTELFETAVRCVRNEADATKQNIMAKKNLFNRSDLIAELEAYTTRIESHQLNGEVNFKHGFWHHKDSRAFNRKANFLLAKELTHKLKNSDESIESIFANNTKLRNNLISLHDLETRWPNRGIHSSTLNKIISHAKKFSVIENKAKFNMR